MLYLTLRQSPEVPLEFEGITPDRLCTLPPDEIAKLPIAYGNRTVAVGEFFEVTGTAMYAEMMIRGDCSRVKRIGAGMAGGRVVVEGNVGMHAGAGMTGGELFVRGTAGDWLGAEMTGGTIRVAGDAGNQVGAGYRGSRRGMTGGVILVTGSIGDEAGSLMRRGLIAAGGSVGEFAAAGMIAGTVVAAGGLGRRAGAGMKRGTLLAAGSSPDLGPGFRFACDYRPAFLGFLHAHLRELNFHPTERFIPGMVKCYRGDIVTGGRGELLLI